MVMNTGKAAPADTESEPLILPGKKKSFKSTAEMLLALLQTIKLTYDERTISRVLSPRISKNVKRVNELAGHTMTIYTTRSVEITSPKARKKADFLVLVYVICFITKVYLKCI